jgi:hypothetical protein
MPNVRLEKIWVTLISHENQGTCGSQMALNFSEIGRTIELYQNPHPPLEPGRSHTFEVPIPAEFKLTSHHFRYQESSTITLQNKLNPKPGLEAKWRANGIIIVGKGATGGKWYLFCATEDSDHWLDNTNPNWPLSMLETSQVGIPD